MAKGTKFKRKELNQPDQFISTTDVVLAYCSKHKTRLISVVTIVVLVVFSGLWSRYNQNIKSLRMESLYFKIVQIKTESGSNPKEIVEKIHEMIKNEPRIYFEYTISLPYEMALYYKKINKTPQYHEYLTMAYNELNRVQNSLGKIDKKYFIEIEIHKNIQNEMKNI